MLDGGNLLSVQHLPVFVRITYITVYNDTAVIIHARQYKVSKLVLCSTMMTSVCSRLQLVWLLIQLGSKRNLYTPPLGGTGRKMGNVCAQEQHGGGHQESQIVCC